MRAADKNQLCVWLCIVDCIDNNNNNNNKKVKLRYSFLG